MKNTIIPIVLIALLISACNSKKIPKDAKIVEPKSMSVTSTASVTLANFSLTIPDGWQEVPVANSMRIKQFKINKYPDFEVVFSYFGNTDNMIEENITRWRGQFSKEDEYVELELQNKIPTGIKLLGTYKSKPFPMAEEFTESPGYGMLAAILPSNEGPYFIKFTAPKEIIGDQESNFIDLLNSYTSK